jgi:phosphocarrier protein
MQRREIEIINKLGLHARPSGQLSQLASAFESDIWVERNGRRVNAKSIMGVMMLAAGCGKQITLEASGRDEEAAIQALSDLFARRFGEAE